jgi:hypothetical protein
MIKQSYEVNLNNSLFSATQQPADKNWLWYPSWTIQVENASGYIAHVANGLSCKDVFPIPDYLPEKAKESLRRKWEKDMVPRIEQEVDLLVALLEIKQTLNLLKSAALSLLKGLKHLWAEGLFAPKAFIKDTQNWAELSRDARKFTLNLSNKWLELNFAWKPLVSDLIGLLNGILDFRAKLEDLLLGQGKIHTAHGSFTDNDAPWESRTGGTACTRCGSTVTCRGDRSRGLHPWEITYPTYMHWKYGLTVKYSYSLPPWVRGTEGAVRALFSSIGLSPGLDVLWEVIPFSFVLDWFWPIGTMLAKASVDPTPVKCTIYDVCVSRKVGGYAEVRATENVCSTGGLQKIADCTYSYYERKVDPSVLQFDWPQFKWPNLFQLSLGLALITQGTKGFKRWGKGPGS